MRVILRQNFIRHTRSGPNEIHSICNHTTVTREYTLGRNWFQSNRPGIMTEYITDQLSRAFNRDGCSSNDAVYNKCRELIRRCLNADRS